MAKVRSVLLTMELRISQRSDNTCARNRNKHPVPRGTAWLAVTEAGSPSSTKHYCIPCAHAILQQAHQTLAGLLTQVEQRLPADENPIG